MQILSVLAMFMACLANLEGVTGVFIVSQMGSSQAFAATTERHHKANLEIFQTPKAQRERMQPPPRPELLSPKALSTVAGTEVKLMWGGVLQAEEHFHLQVATDPRFKWLILDENQVNQNEFALQGLKPGHDYFWRVARVRPSNKPSYTKSSFAESSFRTSE